MMDARRIGGLLCLALLAACETAPTRRSSAPRTTASHQPPAVEPLGYLEQTTGDASPSAALPLVLTLHGRGSRPESFARFFEDFPVPARFVHLRAPVDEGDGLAWFSFRGKGRDEIDAILRDLASRTVASLAEARARGPVAGRPVVLGFSQGAMVAYAVAVDHPTAFARVYPVSGVLFRSLLPPDSSRLRDMPPLRVFHGLADPIISAASGTESVAQLRALGADVEVRTFEGVPHWIMGDMKRALHESLRTFFTDQR